MSKTYFSIVFCMVFNMFSQNTKINHIVNTGVNMTVAILAVDSFVQHGDTIVALYQINDLSSNQSTHFSNPNDFGVGGLTIWEGQRLAIAIWGDDSHSDKKDGFFTNEFINWALLRDKKYLPVQMIYKTGKNVWTPNGISIVDSLKSAS